MSEDTASVDTMQLAREACDLCGITPYSDIRVYAQHAAHVAIQRERERAALAMADAIRAAPADAARETLILHGHRAILKGIFFEAVASVAPTNTTLDEQERGDAA